ncbi:MAG TPA: AbrB/MazE/SpoVT family DNA-binding domain-containing protein [Polyangia bacterium]|jgi:AbrB family looped-hinge helix DNA binding protein
MRASTKLRSKGQVVIPKAIRDRLRWRPGTRLNVEETPDGAVRLTRASVSRAELDQVLRELCGCLRGTDALSALEAAHRAEVEADERRRRR